MSTRKTPLIALVYLSALAQGLIVVSVPASASVLKTVLDDASYGLVFLPQMLATIAGSVWASRLGARALTGPVLALALFSSGAAETLLALTANGAGASFALAATAALGFGFGLSAAALNTLPGRLFPKRSHSALLALHTVLAAGFAAGPALASAAISSQQWIALPLGNAALAWSLSAGALVLLPRRSQAWRTEATEASAADSGRTSRYALLFIAIAICYALAEGTFANWAVVYLREERALSDAGAALALSTFWLALAVGRLIFTGLLARVSAAMIWRGLPLAMTLGFLALPWVRDGSSAVLAFGFAGLGCSAFFPLTVSLSAPYFAGGSARASSLLSAALMVGVGLGSFVIGPLREGVALATLYQWSTLYPLLACGLCFCVPLRSTASESADDDMLQTAAGITPGR